MSCSTTLEQKSRNHLAQLITNYTKKLKAYIKTNVFLKLKNANENEQLCHPELVSGSLNETEILNSNKSCKTEQSTFQNDNVDNVIAGEGFTLAEVLITLGIIGIVAAMTMPTLIQNYRKRVVETRLQKFYSTINQAVKMAEVEYGDKKIWFEDLQGAQIDDDGNPIEGSSEAEKWFNKYLAPHLKIVKRETLYDGTFIVYFPDGSALRQLQVNNTRDWSFYPGNAKKCIEKYNNEITPVNPTCRGICEFTFNFVPNRTEPKWKYHYNKGFEPFKYSWDGKLESLYDNSDYAYTGCNSTKRAYCTALIQYNNWRIPDDYPLKMSY